MRDGKRRTASSSTTTERAVRYSENPITAHFGTVIIKLAVAEESGDESVLRRAMGSIAPNFSAQFHRSLVCL